MSFYTKNFSWDRRVVPSVTQNRLSKKLKKENLHLRSKLTYILYLNFDVNCLKKYSFSYGTSHLIISNTLYDIVFKAVVTPDDAAVVIALVELIAEETPNADAGAVEVLVVKEVDLAAPPNENPLAEVVAEAEPNPLNVGAGALTVAVDAVAPKESPEPAPEAAPPNENPVEAVLAWVDTAVELPSDKPVLPAVPPVKEKAEFDVAEDFAAWPNEKPPGAAATEATGAAWVAPNENPPDDDTVAVAAAAGLVPNDKLPDPGPAAVDAPNFEPNDKPPVAGAADKVCFAPNENPPADGVLVAAVGGLAPNEKPWAVGIDAAGFAPNENPPAVGVEEAGAAPPRAVVKAGVEDAGFGPNEKPPADGAPVAPGAPNEKPVLAPLAGAPKGNDMTVYFLYF